jgi:hypothetical protein
MRSTSWRWIAARDPGLAPRPLPPVDDSLPAPTDLIGAGDVLDIQIYEAGVTLFAGGARRRRARFRRAPVRRRPSGCLRCGWTTRA